MNMGGNPNMKKTAFFAFKGEKMCFMHVLINAIDLQEKGMNAKIIVEGEAVKLIKDEIKSKTPGTFHPAGTSLGFYSDL